MIEANSDSYPPTFSEEDLLRNTDPKEPEYHYLFEAVEESKLVAEYCNEQKREGDNIKKVLEIQKLLDLKDLASSSTRFIREGNLALSRTLTINRDFTFKDTLPAKVYLFNREFLCATEGYFGRKKVFRFSLITSQTCIMQTRMFLL